MLPQPSITVLELVSEVEHDDLHSDGVELMLQKSRKGVPKVFVASALRSSSVEHDDVLLISSQIVSSVSAREEYPSLVQQMLAHYDVNIASDTGSPSDFSSPGQTQISVTHINEEVVRITCNDVVSPTQTVEG